jgi:hypothetical protein
MPAAFAASTRARTSRLASAIVEIYSQTQGRSSFVYVLQKCMRENK